MKVSGLVSVVLIWLGLVAVLGLTSPAFQVNRLLDWSLAAVYAAPETWAAPTLPALPPAPRAGAVLPPPRSGAGAFAVAWLDPVGNQLEILVAKNSTEALPLASLTKLITAAAIEPSAWTEPLVVPPAALVEMPAPKALVAGEVFKTGDLVRALLIESNNQAAMTLGLSREDFVAQLNRRAALLNLPTVHLSNPSGLDPENPMELPNVASAEDLVRLSAWLLAERPDLWAITRTVEAPLYSANGRFQHQLENTNELLSEGLGLPWPIIGSKTGQTDLAKKNLLMVFKSPRGNAYLIAVVLGAEDHFAFMRDLLSWTQASYQF